MVSTSPLSIQPLHEKCFLVHHDLLKLSSTPRRYNLHPNPLLPFLFPINSLLPVLHLPSFEAPAELNAKVGTLKMVKLTLVGRSRDGLPLSQAPAHLNEENLVLSSYKYKAELVLKEISRGALTNPKMTVLIDHHCFHCLVGDGICCITLCESWYPRKLAFYYLQDLQKALVKIDRRVLESFSEPYAFKRFDYVIGKIRERYLDTRTQENLFKLNSDRRNDPDIATEELANIIRNCHSSGSEARTSASAQTKSTIWSSQVLEVSMTQKGN